MPGPIRSIAAALCFALGGASSAGPSAAATASRSVEPASAPPRMAAPAGLACARDQLTSYAGRLQSGQRAANALRLVIATDWGSAETVTVAHRSRDEARRQFTIEGRPFADNDWPRIERSPGRLRVGQQLVAWVCEDGRTPAVIDWRPGAAEPTPRR